MNFVFHHLSSRIKNETDNSVEKLCQNNENCRCCSGLCIDLLTKFEDELGFTYELVRTDDPKFGTLEVYINIIINNNCNITFLVRPI